MITPLLHITWGGEDSLSQYKKTTGHYLNHSFMSKLQELNKEEHRDWGKFCKDISFSFF